MKRCRHSQTLWDAQLEHDGATYSIDALLDSTWTKHTERGIELQDFELVNIELSIRTPDGMDFQSLGLFESLKRLPEALQKPVIDLCMATLSNAKLDSWEQV